MRPVRESCVGLWVATGTSCHARTNWKESKKKMRVKKEAARARSRWQVTVSAKMTQRAKALKPSTSPTLFPPSPSHFRPCQLFIRNVTCPFVCHIAALLAV